MKVIVSAAMSIDGYIDDRSPERLVLSSPEDLAAVEELRATCDAILVGAGTIRRDNPSLITRKPELASRRVDAGKTRDPIKVTVTQSGNLDVNAKFFADGEGEKIVFCPANRIDLVKRRLPQPVTLAPLAESGSTAQSIIAYLKERGLGALLVEGGTQILTTFLSEGAVDEMRLAVAPFFVGDSEAPRLVDATIFPHLKSNRMRLTSVTCLGDTTVMNFSLTRIAP